MRHLSLFLLTSVLIGCSTSSDCVNHVLTSNSSGDGKYTATLFTRNCGATASVAYIIALRNEGDAFDPDDQQKYVFVAEDAPGLALEWSEDRVVAISGVPESDDLVYQMKKTWNGVTIQYD